MKRPAEERVTLVEVFELTGSFEAFQAAVEAAARRLEREGVSSLARVQFYARAERLHFDHPTSSVHQ
jgi:hypothetical protein